jgi:hypothetical protein
MKIKLYILFLLQFWAGVLFAQDLKFIATASKTEVGTNERFEITFAVNGNGDRFMPPTLSGFEIVGGPNQSSSMEVINGNASVSLAYSYVLLAVKEGEYVIGPASIMVNNRKLTTNPVKIKVVKGQRSSAQSQQNQGAPPAGADLADNSLSKTLFLRVVLDKDNVYQGQQLTLTYRLYTRTDIVQSQVTKMPDLTGFWNEDIKGPQKAEWKKETYKGIEYSVADIKQIILFPDHAGNITIDPFAMTFVVRVPAPAKDIMDQVFGGRFEDKQYNAKSAPVVVHVKPLPEKGKPLGFTGAVGNFSVRSTIDKTSLKANEALNYKVTVTGSGNIKLLKELNTNFPVDFEKYDPKIVDSVTEAVSGVSGTRNYSYLLIPRHGGDYKIDPFKFSYFNPTTGKYTSLETKPYDVKVAKGTSETNVTALAGGDKQDVKVLDKDIRYIKIGNAGLEKVGDRFYGSVAFYLLLLLGPVLCIAAYVFRNQNEKYNSDIVKVKSRRAGRVAAKHLANAQKQLTAKNTTAFYEAIFRGLYGYLGDKLNIAYADLNKDIIASTLNRRGVDEKITERLMETLDLCEMARYAPVTHISDQEVFEKAKGIINDIENEI